MTMRILFPLLWLHRNRIINPQQARRRFQRALQAFNLAHGRLQHARLAIVNNFAIQQVQAVHHQSTLWVAERCSLGGVVICPELGDEVGAVLGGVDGQRFGNGQEGVGEFSNRQLFARALYIS